MSIFANEGSNVQTSGRLAVLIPTQRGCQVQTRVDIHHTNCTAVITVLFPALKHYINFPRAPCLHISAPVSSLCQWELPLLTLGTYSLLCVKNKE